MKATSPFLPIRRFSFQTVPVTPPNQASFLHILDINSSASSVRTPYLTVSCDEETLKAECDVTVWQYTDATAYQQALTPELAVPYWADRDVNRIPDTASLRKVQSFKTNLQQDDYTTLLIFPDLLPEGHYLVTCNTGGMKTFGFLQVNDLMLYLSTTETGSLAWANDLATGKPLAGVTLLGSGDAKAVTGEDGTALLPEMPYAPESGTPFFLSASRSGHPSFVAVLSSPSMGTYDNWMDYEYAGKAHWRYLFTDRSTYLPTDTVSYWGIVRAREGGTDPSSLTVTLEKNGYWSYDRQADLILETQSIHPGARGAYEGSFGLVNLDPGSYCIVVRKDGKEVDRRYLGIYRYEKPAFYLSASLKAGIVLPGETVEVDAEGRFFEGTPVPGLELDSSFYYGGKDLGVQTLTLDTKGEAKATTVIPELTETSSWQPQSGWFHANAKNPEEAEISLYESFTVFPRDTMVWVDSTMDKGTFTAGIHVNRINLDVAKAGDKQTYVPEPSQAAYKGEAADIPVHGDIFEHYWDRKVIGRKYDFINKVTYDQYEYFQVDHKVAEFNGASVQGLLTKTLAIPGFREDREYRLVISLQDAKGRKIEETRYLSNWYGYGNGGMNYYQLETVGKPNGYRAGETVHLDLTRDGQSLNESGPGGRVLYMLLRDGHLGHSMSTDGSYEFPFETAYIPNLMAKAVLFDGNKLVETDSCMIRYDTSEKKLTVETIPDAKSYRPGQTVSVDLRVTDASGNPVEASVNVAVVDEAYFAMYEQTADPLGSLYLPAFGTGIINSYISHRFYDPASESGGGAEGGEGDDVGSPVRKDFKDTAWFGSTVTDAAGKGHVSFKLPDNVTTFRVTTQAVTEDLKAGAGKSPVISTLPFFVQSVAQDAYLAGDSPTILLRAYGSGMTSAETRFTVSLTTEDGKTDMKEAVGSGSNYVGIPLDPLQPGKVVLTVKGVNGSNQDTVERTIRVEKNLLTIQRTSFLPVRKGMRIEATDSPATLTIYNKNVSILNQALWSLYGSYGSRVDKVIARQMAARYLKDILMEPYVEAVPETDFKPWQKDDGGIALLPYDSSDVVLSAKICSVNPDLFDSEKLSGYFTTILEDEKSLPMHAAAAMWGLAALGEPVLLDVRALVSDIGLKDDEKMVYALALADLGDLDGASALYGSLAGKYEKKSDPYKWFDFGRDKDDTLQMTAYAAMLAKKTGHADADSLYAYLQNNQTRERPILLEQLALLDGRVENVSTTGSATLIVDGKPQPFVIKGQETFRAIVKPEQLAGLQFEDIKGDLDLAVVSRGSALTLDKGENRVATIQRKYLVNGVEKDTIGPLDTVEVNLEIQLETDAPGGNYELSDLLPAGLRYTYGSGRNIGPIALRLVGTGWTTDPDSPSLERGIILYGSLFCTGVGCGELLS